MLCPLTVGIGILVLLLGIGSSVVVKFAGIAIGGPVGAVVIVLGVFGFGC